MLNADRLCLQIIPDNATSKYKLILQCITVNATGYVFVVSGRTDSHLHTAQLITTSTVLAIGTVCVAFEVHIVSSPTSKRAHKLMTFFSFYGTGQSLYTYRRDEWRDVWSNKRRCIKSPVCGDCPVPTGMSMGTGWNTPRNTRKPLQQQVNLRWWCSAQEPSVTLYSVFGRRYCWSFAQDLQTDIVSDSLRIVSKLYQDC